MTFSITKHEVASRVTQAVITTYISGHHSCSVVNTLA